MLTECLAHLSCCEKPSTPWKKDWASWNKISRPLPPPGCIRAHTANPRLQLQQTLSPTLFYLTLVGVFVRKVLKRAEAGQKMLSFRYNERTCLFGLYLPSLDTCMVQSPSWHVVEAHQLIFFDHVIHREELKQQKLWPPVPQKWKGSINFQRWQ